MSFLGFGFSGYRSIGELPALIAPLKKINFIIGENNIGKSNITLFLKHHLERELNRAITRNQNTSLGKLDKPIGNKSEFSLLLPVPNDIESLRQHILNYEELRIPEKCISDLSKALQHSSFYPRNSISWVNYSETGNGLKVNANIFELSKIMHDNEWYQVWRKLTKMQNGEIKDWITGTLNSLATNNYSIPKVELIPAIRKIGSADIDSDDFSGEGIINRLAKLQNPALDSQTDKIKFRKINTFLQCVLDNKSAILEIPHERNMILVHMDGKTLPLSSLGTGIHEVIILATAATVLDETLLCVEEPELHLHPLLQKKLIQYLSENTSNQYLFTTHSAHLLDTVGAEVFFVRKNDERETIVDAVTTTEERSNICHELGYRASDILQSNSIIWVEGPSDRTYLNFWIKHKNNTLIEGIHYSIMFYGGRLFSHLSAAHDEYLDETTNEFIALRKLNRWSSIMFDSDKASPQAHLSKTKKRLRDEFNLGPGFTWITKGREIENYIDPEIIERCVKDIHPHAVSLNGKSTWDNTLKYTQKGTKNSEATADKVKIAKHYIATNKPDYSKLDLNEKIEQLIAFIKAANGIH